MKAMQAPLGARLWRKMLKFVLETREFKMSIEVLTGGLARRLLMEQNTGDGVDAKVQILH